MKGRDDGSDSDEYLIKKIKTHDFEFQMNHIKQVIKIEIIANCRKRNEQS